MLAWEITDLLDKTPGAVIDPDDNDYGSFMLEEWITPFSISDGLPNNVWHIAVANEVWNDGTTERDEVYVYVAVGRYGIAVLRFDPDAASGQRLVLVHSIKTPSGMGGLRIRENETLLFAESLAGIRTFVRPQ